MSMDRRLAHYRRAIEAPFDRDEGPRFYYEAAKCFLEKLDQIEDEQFAQESATDLGWLTVPGFEARRLVRQIRDEQGVVIGWSSLETGKPTWNAGSYLGSVFEPLTKEDIS